MKRRILVLLLLIFFAYAGSLLVLPPPSPEGRTYVYSSRVTYVNRGVKPQSLEPDLTTFNIFMNTSWQTAYVEATNRPYELTTDTEGNTIMVFNFSTLPPGENATISYTVRLEEKARTPPDVSIATAGYFSDIPKAIKEAYTKIEGSWLVDEELKSLANMVWTSQGQTTNVLKLASGLADWIGKNVRSVSHDTPYYPNETYSSRKGDCDDQANLLIALLRVLGVPAYLQVGALKASSTTASYWEDRVRSNLNGISYHGWAMVYVPPWGWLPFDMTLGWSGGNSLSVIKSAKAWSLDAVSILSVTKSDWAGQGKAQKEKIMAGSVYIYYDETLTSTVQGGFPQAVADWRLWSVVAAVLSVSVVAAAVYLKFKLVYLPSRLSR